MYLNYGKEKLLLELPKGISWKEIKITEMPVLENPDESVREAIRRPIDSPPLRDIVKPGESVCLLVNDPTRVARSEVFLPVLIEEMKEAGVKEEDMFIVFTTGTHRTLDDDEMASLVGSDIAARIPMFNHDCYNDDELVSVGTTSRGTPVQVNKKVLAADRRILTGSIVHHFFAGFGGGRKALIPGVAGYETIKINHSLLLDDRSKIGVTIGNPAYEDQVEAALMVGGDFLLNVVLNEKKEFLGVYAGDMVTAHLKACEFVEKVYGCKIDALADVAIASSGGYPKDINIYQAQKTLENAVNAVKVGGSVILLAECPEGTGSQVYEKWARQYPCFEDLTDALRKDFHIGGHKAYVVARALQRARVYLVSSLSPDVVRALGFIPAESLQAAVEEVFSGLSAGQDLLAYVMPQGSLTVPVLT
ncbi:MAG: nickel-dependent lactate racemase [Dethiobacter sp.]|jgi:nickel-dependent lactate racemase|nr:nickel-dependent lactate racemase [Dethiobacter sp.]